MLYLTVRRYRHVLDRLLEVVEQNLSAAASAVPLRSTYSQHLVQVEIRGFILRVRRSASKSAPGPLVGSVACGHGRAWGIPICPHGTSGLGWAGRLQASAAMGSMTQEIAVLNPPQLPDDRVKPAMPILNSVPFVYRDGEVVVPQGPGLGLDLNEEAINRFRVDGPVHVRGVYPENIRR